jgi:hypothetical protein
MKNGSEVIPQTATPSSAGIILAETWAVREDTGRIRNLEHSMETVVQIVVALVLFVLAVFLLPRFLNRFRTGVEQGIGSVTSSEQRPPQRRSSASPEEFLRRIPDIADQHVETVRNIFGEELDYSEESIAQLDKIIQKGWPDRPPAMLEPTVVTFGAYLGETIRRNIGGEWGFAESEGYYLDGVGEKAKIFPFAKVTKRFKNGEEDSLEFYYKAIKHTLEEEE